MAIVGNLNRKIAFRIFKPSFSGIVGICFIESVAYKGVAISGKFLGGISDCPKTEAFLVCIAI